MPAVTIPTPAIGKDPGFLFYAPLGTPEPTHTVLGSVFTDAWPAPWLILGATDAGSAFNWQTSTDTIEAAEFLDPLAYVSTGRTGSVAFGLLTISATNLKRSLNGGTIATTGTTTTTMSSYTPPALGQEVRCMIGWESQDSTERLIAFQCFNTAQVTLERRKGNARAVLPVEYALEVPAGGQPFRYLTAGAARA